MAAAVTVRRVVDGARRSVAARMESWALSARSVWLLLFAAVVATGAAVVALGVGEDVTQHNGAATSDPQHLQLFVDHRPSWLVAAARSVTAVGAVPVLAVIAVAVAAVLWWRGQRLVVALAPGIALACAGTTVAVLKPLVGRARPDLAVRLATEGEASFPSGHSADSTALFVTLAVVVAAVVLRRPLTRVVSVGAAVAVSGAIGLSRLVLAVHWPTDVIAGWAIGLLVAVGIGTIAALTARMAPPDPADRRRVRSRVAGLLLARRRGVAARSFAA